MKKTLRFSIIFFIAVVVTFSSCRKFLDVNENPNLPQEGSPELLLPYSQAAIGNVLGSDLAIYGGIWGQYWTQNPFSSQYRGLEQYSVSTTSFDRTWRRLYSDALEDLQVIQNLAANEEEFSQYAAISYILKAYTFQVATDGFGDIPLAEALNPDITSPAYTPQEQVYDTIISYLDTGISMIDVESTNAPGNDDLLFGGDMRQWIKFANTLKLRVFLRQSEVAPDKAMAGIAELSGAEFLDEDAQINYSTTGGNQNPLFEEMLGLGRVQNFAASETITKFLTDNNDPRADVFFERYQTDEQDSIIGIPQGSYRTTNEVFSIPSTAVGASGNEDQSAQAPVKFISAAESYFLQAEAVVRGWLTSDATATELFEQGITSSFESYEVPGVDVFLENSPAAQFPAGKEQQIRAIILQKWVAMTGNQGFEAWTEWRRTGYPDFFTVSEATSLGDDRMPARLLYPASEVTRNINFEEFPGLKQVYEPVWWDVKD
ncbi:MAG: SusD/RagB family nutrient-binding outer membrane lipoprotein [Chitinophagaceae bacterium]|nr:SusD/RagB family nutrient-binding outer membrane lipoprotein [Chitinophagaceae bacterium]